MDALREFLILECERRNLSWRQASLRAGLDHSAVSRFINGTQPTVKSARKLAQFFHVPETEILILAGRVIRDQSAEPGTELEYRILERFRKLSEEQKRLAIAHADLLIEYGGGGEEE